MLGPLTSRVGGRCFVVRGKFLKSTRGFGSLPKRNVCLDRKRILGMSLIRQYRQAVATDDIDDSELLAPIPDIKVPIIWILGGPGSGKGTQCDKIVAKYGFTHLSSGDLLRAEVSSGSPRGQELSFIMERGELVPMEVVLDLLREAIVAALPTSKGFLIDGYPREKEQGVMFEKSIAPVDVVLFFDATEGTLVERLLGRAKTSGRVDDNEVTIKKRLNTFNTHNDQVVQQYREKLKKINAERTTDEIFAEVTTYLDPLLPQ